MFLGGFSNQRGYGFRNTTSCSDIHVTWRCDLTDIEWSRGCQKNKNILVLRSPDMGAGQATEHSGYQSVVEAADNYAQDYKLSKGTP
jgi:hypothetical protein